MNDIDENGNPIAPPAATDEPKASFEDQLPADNAGIAPVSADNAIHGGADVIREQDKIMLILAYLFPIVPFLTVKDSEYVTWHARQGLVNWILSIIISCTCIGAIFCIYVCVKGIIESLKPNRWEAPLVSNITKAIFKQ